MLPLQTNNDVFRAIADPTRRAILDRLRAGPANAGALAADFRSSRPAVSKHLRVPVSYTHLTLPTICSV